MKRASLTTCLALAGCSLLAPDDDTLSGEHCDNLSCRPIEPSLAYWLASNPGGYCLDRFKKVVPLCVSDDPAFSNPNRSGNFCFDDLRTGRDRLRRTYPNGIRLDVGFHYAGARGGHILTLGSSDALLLTCDPDTPGVRIVVGIDGEGRLYAHGPRASTIVANEPLAPGSHLVSYAVSVSRHALWLDGHLVGRGGGNRKVVVDMPERWAPGFVLGASNQRWWSCSEDSPSRWLAMAPFFVHLQDRANMRSPSITRDLEPGPDTVILFDKDGARGPRWLPSGLSFGEPTEQERLDRAGRAVGAAWVDDAMRGCF